MEIPLLRDILVIFSLSIFVLLACHKLKVPSVVGFLFTGLIAGPGGFGMIKGMEDVEKLSHIGIVFLLFSVGLEFSLKKILEYKRIFFVGGVLQVFLTVLFGFLVAEAIGRPFTEAIFLGFLLSLSSTAIVMKLIQEKGESSTPHGRTIIGTLIFQDVIAIPMLLIIPLLGHPDVAVVGSDLFFRALLGFVLLVAVFWVSISVMPRLLDIVSRTRSRELFLLTVLVVCFSVAWVTSEMGLSLSIGAFLAGLILSDSDYSREAIGDILPLRDLFLSFFFVSIGMLCNVRFMIENLLELLALSGGVIALKGFLAIISVLVVGLPLRTAVISGLAVAQIGEFSFVLAKVGFIENLGTFYLYQLFLGVSLITMAVTPFLFNISERVAKMLQMLPLPQVIKSGFQEDETVKVSSLKNHVIIVGFGITGQHLAKALKETSIPYVIIEMNSETVKKMKKRGEPIIFGDATHESMLKHACIKNARALSVVINDPAGSLRVVEAARRETPSIYIIGRTRRIEEMSVMAQLGANDVIPDEFGTSIEIFSRVLRVFQVPPATIEALVEGIRLEGYSLLRKQLGNADMIDTLGGDPAKVNLETFIVHPKSFVANKDLEQSEIRKNTSVSVLMIRRGDHVISEILPKTVLMQGDKVTVSGSKESLKKAQSFFEEECLG